MVRKIRTSIREFSKENIILNVKIIFGSLKAIAKANNNK